MHFTYYMPTKVVFGCGEFEQAADKIVKIGSRVLLITGKHAMKALGYTDKLVEALVAAGAEVNVFAGVSAEPHADEVNDCVARYQAWQPTVVVALGGGSVIDAAKGVLLGLSIHEPVEDYLTGKKSAAAVAIAIPLVAIPTTAGTGAELNWASILTDTKAEIKTSFRHEKFFPTLTIADPMLTVSLSPTVTRETGFDAFCHAVETSISRAATPLAELYAKETIALLRDHLPTAVQDGSNIAARTAVQYASMIMGASLANSATCLPHRLQYPIGIRTGSSHGAGLIILFRPWLEHTYELSADKFDSLFSILANKPCQGKEAVLAAFDQFAAQIGANYKLETVGLTAADVTDLIARVAGSLANDPAGETTGIIDKMYNSAI